VPGYKLSDLKLDLRDNAITLKGERKMPEDLTTSSAWYLHERPYGSFTRRIDLPSNIPLDETKTQAWYRDGVMEIKIPRMGGKVKVVSVPISLADRLKQTVGVGGGNINMNVEGKKV